jgi:putative hydrolase of the HAD superfamily
VSAAVRAVLWDFGGVILESPFDAFARYEVEHELPAGFIRKLNSTNPDTNAWARLERSEVNADEFCALFEAEADAMGYRLDAAAVLGLLSGQIRPAMVTAVARCRERLKTALLTNNFVSFGEEVNPREPAVAEILGMFDVVIESSKVGVRKPDPKFYELACDALGIEPDEAVFLDDLGINLKPAKLMGMRTIKVTDPVIALAELEEAVGFPVG